MPKKKNKAVQQKPEDKKLTLKEEFFCQHFVALKNGTKAVLEAGYDQTEKAAAVTATRMLKKAKIQKRIDQLIEDKLKAAEVTPEKIIRELAAIAFQDLSDAYDENGNLKPIKEIPKKTRKAIAGIKVFEEYEGQGKDRVKIGETRELRLNDKRGALKDLKELFYAKRHEISGPDGKPIETADKTKQMSDEELDKRIAEHLKKK